MFRAISIFVSFNLLLIQLSVAQNYRDIIAATANSDKINLPTKINNIKELEDHLYRLPKSKLRDSYIQSLKGISNNKFPIIISRSENKIETLGLTIDFTKSTITYNGQSHIFDTNNLDFEAINKFLHSSYLDQKTSFLNLIIGPVLANPLEFIVIGAVFFLIMGLYELSGYTPHCSSKLVNRNTKLIEHLNNCNEDIIDLEEGSDPRQLDTAVFMQAISSESFEALAQQFPSAGNCSNALRQSINPCIEKDDTIYKLHSTCETIKELDRCLKRFKEFDLNSNNSSSRTPVNQIPTDSNLILEETRSNASGR